MNQLLEYWLGRHYAARVLGSGNLALVKAAIRERFAADQTLAAEGRKELERINALGSPDELHKRCFVSKIHREALTELLPAL